MSAGWFTKGITRVNRVITTAAVGGCHPHFSDENTEVRSPAPWGSGAHTPPLQKELQLAKHGEEGSQKGGLGVGRLWCFLHSPVFDPRISNRPF